MNFSELFNVKTMFVEWHRWNYWTHSGGNKGVHAFPKSINPKVNVIAKLKFELAYIDTAVEHFSYDTFFYSLYLFIYLLFDLWLIAALVSSRGSCIRCANGEYRALKSNKNFENLTASELSEKSTSEYLPLNQTWKRKKYVSSFEFREQSVLNGLVLKIMFRLNEWLTIQEVMTSWVVRVGGVSFSRRNPPFDWSRWEWLLLSEGEYCQ